MRHASSALVAMVAIVGCSSSKRRPPGEATDATPTAALLNATVRTWHVRFETLRPPGVVASTLDVFGDGDVVFGFAPTMAKTVATAPPELLAKVASELVEKKLPSEIAVDATVQPAAVIGVVDDKETVIGEARYPIDAIPPAVKTQWDALSALVNSPRRPRPCMSWDGTDGFELKLYSQDFGGAPGPIFQTTFQSDGVVVRTAAGGGIGAPFVEKARTQATPREIEAVRKALLAIDFNALPTDRMLKGVGSGSNLRSIFRFTRANECGRSFENEYPPQLAPLFAAMKPVIDRLIVNTP